MRTMPTRNRRVALMAFLLGAATCMSLPRAVAVSSPQTAHSNDGLLAHGYVDLPFPDGTTRRIDVTLVVPRGNPTSTPATGMIDLRRPWTVVSQWITDDPPSQARHDGTRSCESLFNPSTIREGSRSPDGRAWVGTSVDVVCDDGAGFDFYRVTWSPGPFWLVTNEVATAVMGGTLTTWATERASGVVTGRPLANQQAVVTVCGHRLRHVECFGGASGWGTVIPSVDKMTTYVQSS